MRKFIEDGADDHEPDQDADGGSDLDEDKGPANWSVAVTDDCETCDDPRVVLTVEPRGEHGRGVVAHLGPATARRLRAALANGLREIGEPVD